MDYIHVVNGDSAARLLGEALDGAGRDDRIVVLRDDLAVGPLRSIDDSHTARVVFWQRVLGASEHGISQTISDAFDAGDITLHNLAVDDNSEIVLWHAQNAGDQLMLRRIAYHLRTTPQRLNEIGVQARWLVHPDGGTPGDGSCTPEALSNRLKSIAPISLLRITRLALEWQELKQVNLEMRRWRDNTFQSAQFTDLDAAIIEYTGVGWQSYLAVAHRIRHDDPGIVATDAIIAWRCRELAAQGRLDIDNDAILEKSTQIRQLLAPGRGPEI